MPSKTVLNTTASPLTHKIRILKAGVSSVCRVAIIHTNNGAITSPKLARPILKVSMRLLSLPWRVFACCSINHQNFSLIHSRINGIACAELMFWLPISASWAWVSQSFCLNISKIGIPRSAIWFTSCCTSFPLVCICPSATITPFSCLWSSYSCYSIT